MLQVDLNDYGVAAGWNRLPGAVDPTRLSDTSADPSFPGAILPAVNQDGAVYWYAAARTGAEWRRLQPLLVAFVGPTVTGFRGQSAQLDVNEPAERFLIDAGVYAVARLVPGRDCEVFAKRALERLRFALAHRPAATTSVPIPTATLIAKVDMYLAAGDRDGALRLLEVLRAEFRLDTLNIHFLEVRILSAFRAWHEMISKEWFASLAVTRKPAAVATAMLEALWFEFLEQVPESQLEERYMADVRPLARLLLRQASAEMSFVVPRLLSLEGEPTRAAPGGGAAAQELLDDAFEAPCMRRVSEAQEAIDALPAEARKTVLESAIGQRAAAEVLSFAAPTNWTQWLDALDDPAFIAAADVARDGVRDWPARLITTAEMAAPIAEGMLRIGLTEGIGRARLIESIPSLVRWVNEDSEYPRRALADIYDSLLQLLSLLDHRGSAERHAAVDLLDSRLALGVTHEGYRRALQDVATLIDPAAGLSSVYWLLDLASTLLQYPAPLPEQRLALLNAALNSFQPLLRLLSIGQRAAYSRVAEGASWPTLPAPVVPSDTSGISQLAGKTIGIYTLTESAGRQAVASLKEIEPSLSIELLHDHVASPRLTRVSRDADLFVLAAASAKHAATDCIVANRRERPLLYASGRGFSGIVRVVEEYASRLGQHDTRH